MNIGIDASRTNKKAMTGTEWYSYHVIEHILKNDKDNHFTLYFRDKENQSFYESKNTKIRNIPWLGRHFWTQGGLSLEMLLHKPDLLFVPAHVLPFFAPASVTTCHDVGFKRYPELYTLRERLYHGYSMWKSLKEAAAIITISEFSKKEIIDLYGADESKVYVVYNGYDSNIYNESKDDAGIERTKEQYNIEGEYIYAIGRKETKKNICGLIDIFSELKTNEEHKDLKLVIVGSAGFGYEQIKNKMNTSKWKEHIIETGWISSQDAVHLLKGSRALVFPSYYEGFGLPLIEAMACGIPVVSSNRASLPEIAGDAALLCDPDQHAIFAEHIHKVLSDMSVRSVLIQRGHERARDFSWDTCGQQTLDIIHKVLNQ